MDTQGNYTDRHGRPLAVGTRVRVTADYEYDGPPEGTGVVVTLPTAESRHYYGFPSVAFDADGKKRHIPESALLCIDAEPGSTIAHLEEMIATTRARNTAMKDFLRDQS